MDSRVMKKLARDYIRRARSRLIDAEYALRRGDYPEVVRYSQECVELSLKAALRFVGIEYPKVHDVGDVLIENAEKFPMWSSDLIQELARISSELALARGPSMYGDEVRGIPPSELFDEDDAKEALRKAKRVYRVCADFIEHED